MQGNDQNDLEWLTDSECRNYIGGRIGEGAYGCVYKFKGHNDLVIKEVDKNNQSSTPLKSYDDELRLLPLLDHPGIIKYKKVLVHNNTIYTIMKKYPDTLSDIIRLHSRDSTTIPERKIFSFAYQIASALEYLHNPCKVCSANERVSCVLHRDLKPNNIMVDDDGEHIVVADFGLCREGFGTASKAVGNRRYQSLKLCCEMNTFLSQIFGVLDVSYMSFVLLIHQIFYATGTQRMFSSKGGSQILLK